MLTQEQFKRALPAQMSKKVNQQLIDSINKTLTDPNTADMMRENILGFTNVLKEGKFKMDSYISAVKYVSYKMMGDTNIRAYAKTFPNRYQNFLSNGTSEKDIASYVTAYNKNKLVNLVLEQTLIPTHILNAHVHQKAINRLATEMEDMNVIPRDRIAAAGLLLQHLKQPEVQKVEMDIGVKDDSLLKELKDITTNLAAQQKAAIDAGAYSPKDIAHQDIVVIEGESEEV